MNWRKPIIYGLLYVTGSKIPKCFNEIKRIEKLSSEDIKKYQLKKLKKLLLHAYKNVPYYHKVLAEANVVVNGKVNLENFDKIPILNKEIMRREGKNLYSRDHKKRKSYENTSGGSTGEPIKFIQDKYYDEWNIATNIYFNWRLGKKIGEPSIKLWGSDIDIIKGNLALRDRIINYLYNRIFFNSYNFTEENMNKLVRLNNSFKPVSYWAYIDALTEFSKYALKNDIKLSPPKFILSTIGPIYPKTRKIIEKVFNCKVYNQYGSREMGSISSQNKDQKEQDVFFWRQFVEILDVKKNKSKNCGELVITCLDNYSMPLIRYEIGDVAVKGNQYYEFGKTKSYLSLKDTIGRTLGFFKKRDGTLIHTHFIIQQLFFKDWIKQFQLIQRDYNFIECRIVGKKNEKDIKEIIKTAKILMGNKCKFKFNFVKEIKPTKSGKYLYTICEVKHKNG